MRKILLGFLLSAVFAGAVNAATVTLTWTPPTTRTDSSALPPAQINHADIYDSFSCGTTPCTNPAGIVIGTVTGAVGTFKTPALAAGSHTFTVFTTDNGTPPAVSPPSNAATFTITISPPAAVTNLTGTIGP